MKVMGLLKTGKKITVCQTAFDFKLVSSSLVVSHLHLAGDCLGPLCWVFLSSV